MNKLTLTDNKAISYKTTNSNLVDLFIKSVRNTSKKNINYMMKKAWNENPELTIKLIFYTRDIRNGKGEREISFYMLEFLREYMYDTYKINIKNLSLKYGRLKDLIDLAKTNIYNDIELNIFADILKEDLTKKKPSLAVKWAPREGKKYNNITLLLAKILFPNDDNDLELYRKNILNPLTKKITIIEQLMCKNKWEFIKYNSVPSQAMKIYGRDKSQIWDKFTCKYQNGAFYRHDLDRFEKYKNDVKKGKQKINIQGIHPHQLVKEVYFKEDEIIDLQWNEIINNLKNIDSIKSSIAIIDVSGSMKGLPIEVAISLGLIISELASEPFNKKIITFSEYPLFHNIVGDTLHKKILNISKVHWGMSTNIEKVFNLLLDTAKLYDISDEKMIKNIFIFTDMHFNEAINCDNNTLFENIKQKYINANYSFPKIIFWNLRDSKDAFPIKIDEYGAYLSGFSIDLLKIFMEGIDFNPINILDKLLSKYNVEIDTFDNDKIFNIEDEDESLSQISIISRSNSFCHLDVDD